MKILLIVLISVLLPVQNVDAAMVSKFTAIMNVLFVPALSRTLFAYFEWYVLTAKSLMHYYLHAWSLILSVLWKTLWLFIIGLLKKKLSIMFLFPIFLLFPYPIFLFLSVRFISLRMWFLNFIHRRLWSLAAVLSFLWSSSLPSFTDAL